MLRLEARPQPSRAMAWASPGIALSLTALLAAVRARLGPLKAPKAVVWRQDWPLLPSGKTDLRRIEAEVGG